MPRRAARNCTRPGCAGLVRESVCSVCGPLRRRTQREKDYDQERGSASQRGYGVRWRRLRRMFLRANPLCWDCDCYGNTTAAEEVHHVVALRDGGTNEWNNLLALCKTCHSRRTARGE